MKQIITLLIAFLAILPVFSREIKGRIIDENNTPLDFVNVVLYCDSTYIAGGISDPEGNFSISAETGCSLTTKVSFVGYEDLAASVPQSGDMGVITLRPSAVELGEVVVKATRPSTTMKGNALVTNVEGSQLAIAGTANDVLVRVPMVVDNGGSLEVFGKGAPAIYINGRKVNDLQELSQLNSGDIKNVEVITNPGAAYAADVKSVIRIRTKPPKGDGFSGTFRTDNGFQHYFRTGNSIDLKYRTGGLEIFANYGWWWGYNLTDRTDDMTTTTSMGTYLQKIITNWKEKYNDMNGKIGFSWLINEKHSVGAYYRNGWNRHNMSGETPTEVWQNGKLIENIATEMNNRFAAVPMHSANVYYNGSVGKLGIDFNADYLWSKSSSVSRNLEAAEIGTDRDVNTSSTDRNRMFAEKLVLTYPLWHGQIEVGEEYTNTRTTNLFTANIPEIDDADNRVDESNIAAFAELGQQLGRFMVGVGLRYERVKFNYYEMGLLQDGQSKTYNNIFPSLNVATQAGNVRMGLNYTGKTVRPGYGQLDGAVSYINRLTYETGNPYLKPTKMQTVEYMAQWRRFFAQLSYTYFKDGVYHITEPYGADGEATIIRTANLNHRHYFQAFVGGNFQVGVWQPKVNVGMMKQWLTLPVNGEPMKMNTPIFMFQWQNAVHLPFDIWLNVDAQLMTRGWDTNTCLTNNPWYVNAKIYKGFFNNAFSVTLEAKDIFDSAKNNFDLYSDAVQIQQKNFSPGRSVMLTLQYRFNTTRDRYRGTGAGNSEKSRF
ncbi:MAG: outer membrane beta-barrel protein [Muribaculaceae bacterium]|uniref:outer membrane beta-barrel family protein n=1 Tax=uncultured Duncaniella sp. TaxID=2768039 RepID=UPI002627E404|nr:outer membrane beta-barrel family protein [uncultured Duncaniella sp.]MCI9055586.1 outer membrane beta-barrel protein [Muribaculaceae bacterium]